MSDVLQRELNITIMALLVQEDAQHTINTVARARQMIGLAPDPAEDDRLASHLQRQATTDLANVQRTLIARGTP